MIRRAAFLLMVCFVQTTWALSDDKPVQCPPFSFSPTANPERAPHLFAWELFAYVNQKVVQTGAGHTVLWETWASPQDLYCHARINCDPHTRPQWPDHRDHVFKPGPMIETEMLIGRPVNFSDASAAVPGPGGEVRINCGTFKHISDNHLWYLEGQEKAFQDGKEIVFPTDAIEVKAFWIQIDEDVKERYHWQKSDQTYFGLISLSIASRALPHWFWATFEHVDNPQRCIAPNTCLDDTSSGGLVSAGLTSNIRALLRNNGLKEPGWLNYRLIGTQSTFSGMDAVTGTEDAPSLLANSIFEFSLVTRTSNTSSCITCHARVTVDYQGNRLCIGKKDKTGYVGEPLRSWYCDDSGKMKFLPLGFVWSLLEAESIHGGTDLHSCGKPAPVKTNGPDCANIPQLAIQ